MSATNPLLLTVAAPRLLGDHLSVAHVFGLILGFGGVVFVIGARLDGAGADTGEGAVLAFSGVTCLVAATMLYKQRPPRQHLLVAVAVGIVLINRT